MSRRYVWRVTAHYSLQYSDANKPEDVTTVPWTTTKHYHTAAAARHRAAVITGAVEPANPEWVNYRPRPDRVVIERSAPVDGWEPIP